MVLCPPVAGVTSHPAIQAPAPAPVTEPPKASLNVLQLHLKPRPDPTPSSRTWPTSREWETGRCRQKAGESWGCGQLAKRVGGRVSGGALPTTLLAARPQLQLQGQ